MLTVLIVSTLVTIAVFCWLFYVINKTGNDKINMIPKAEDPEFWVKMARLESVSFEKHMWYLATFRDPKRLYR
jgi:uncharacterized membrane protein (DUF106 family)